MTQILTCTAGPPCDETLYGSCGLTLAFTTTPQVVADLNGNSLFKIDCGATQIAFTLGEDPKYATGVTKASIKQIIGVNGKSVIVNAIKAQFDASGIVTLKLKSRTGTDLGGAFLADDILANPVEPDGVLEFSAPIELTIDNPGLTNDTGSRGAFCIATDKAKEKVSGVTSQTTRKVSLKPVKK